MPDRVVRVPNRLYESLVKVFKEIDPGKDEDAVLMVSGYLIRPNVEDKPKSVAEEIREWMNAPAYDARDFHPHGWETQEILMQRAIVKKLMMALAEAVEHINETRNDVGIGRRPRICLESIFEILQGKKTREIPKP